MAKKSDIKHDDLIAVRMESHIVEDLKRIGEVQDRSVSWLVRKACVEFIERQPKSKK
jgi:predicted transcriptional regulator